MAWQDYSNTDALSWDPAYGATTPTSTDVVLSPDIHPFDVIIVSNATGNSTGHLVNELNESYNIPGFEDGYQPNYVPNPISGNLSQPDPDGGGGGGSTRPTTGMLYPRGQG